MSRCVVDHFEGAAVINFPGVKHVRDRRADEAKSTCVVSFSLLNFNTDVAGVDENYTVFTTVWRRLYVAAMPMWAPQGTGPVVSSGRLEGEPAAASCFG